MTISECTRNIPCIDCDNTACFHQGKKESDCPKYRCDRQGDGFMECDRCEFIDRFIEDIRRTHDKRRGNL
jgi:hypothetical protein